MMVGGEVDEELAPEESRTVDEWPPPATNLELTNKDGESRLLFLTVQYVGPGGPVTFNPELESFSELEERVVSPLDPNLGCTGSLSPVYRPSTPLIHPPVSPSGGYLNPSSPSAPATTLAESGMIVLSDQCQFTAADNYVVTSGNPLYSQSQITTDDGKLLLLSTDSAQPNELVVSGGEPCGDQRVELLLNNGTIAYGIVESSDNTGIRVIQIPKEYLVTTPPTDSHDTLGQENRNVQNETIPIAGSVPNESVHVDNGQDESEQDKQLRALYNTLKEQGLIIEPGELRLETDLDQNQQLMDTSLLDQPTLLHNSARPTSFPTPEPQRRFWCAECNILLESDCQEHQINRKITDKAVPSRARATLPASYLAINRIPDSTKEEYGVFARKAIPKRTQFGPIEGTEIKSEDVMVVPEKPYLELSIETDGGDLKILDVSNEYMSNWMRFVRMATSGKPPNLLVSQLGKSLYFTTTHQIRNREELLVWYSPAYAARRNLPVDPPPTEFPCATCGMKLKTFTELSTHANTHKPSTVDIPLDTETFTLFGPNGEFILL